MIEIRNKYLHLEEIVGVDFCVLSKTLLPTPRSQKCTLFLFFYCLGYFRFLVHFENEKNKFFKCASFANIVMAIQNRGIGKTFVVRKLAQGVGTERTFPMNSPIIDNIVVTRKGKVRQARLFYLRDLVKQPKIKERR